MVRFILVLLLATLSDIESISQSVAKFYVVKDTPVEIDSLRQIEFQTNESEFVNDSGKKLERFIKDYNDSLFKNVKLAIIIKPAVASGEISNAVSGDLCYKRLTVVITYILEHTELRKVDLSYSCIPASVTEPSSAFISFTKRKKPTLRFVVPKEPDVMPKFDRWKADLSTYLSENIACGSNKKELKVRIFVQMRIDSVGYVKKGSVKVLHGAERMTNDCHKRLIKIMEKSPQWTPAHSLRLNRDISATVVQPINF